MRKTAFLIVVAMLGFACQSQDLVPTIEERLQKTVDAVVSENDAVRSSALHVDSPALGLAWAGASGLADPAAGTPMTPRNPSRIASNTKTFIAAAVLRLHEEEILEIFDPIRDHLPQEYVAALEGDGYDTTAITVRHLLTHTSGLFDHTSPDLYVETILADPMHRWTRGEQLRGAVDWGDPLGEPGEFYTYCDTGYVLLGAVIEHTLGHSMAGSVRELVDYDRLGLSSTWWETLEPRPDGVPDRAHQFFGDVDTYDFDPSYDLYGGGGLASTVGDLARFYRALFTGGVYADPATAEIMLTTIDGAQALPGASDRALPPGAYRMGIWVTEVEGYTAYMHTGFFGTLAAYFPELDLALAVAVNQNQSGGALRGLTNEAVKVVAESRE
jgi:D-alanyl-D-alanine carboxypeptidase